jgi:hypothetical protein
MRRLIIKVTFVFIGLLVLLSILLLQYGSLFRTTNWDKYYFQKMLWKEIITDPTSHTEPIIVFLVILVIAILAVMVGEKMKNKKKLK